MKKQAPSELRRFLPAWSASQYFHCAFAVAAISLYILGSMAHSKVSGLPSDFPLHELSYPVSMGTYTVSSEPELLARIAGEPVGTYLVIRSPETNAEFFVVTQKLYTAFHDLIIKINGLFFLAVSLIVFAPRIEKVPARDLFWACLLYGLTVTIGGVHQPQGSLWPGAFVPMMRIFALVIMPTLMLHVGLSFPHRTAALDRLPWLMPAVMILGLAVASWQSWTWILWFSGQGSWEALALPSEMGGLFLAVFFCSGCAGMVFGFRKSQQEREREQVKWLLWGITMGSMPFIFLHGLPVAFGHEPVIPIEVARLFSIVIPIAMSFVVIRHKFLDVDIIIRRSLLYILLASMMVGIYAVIGIFIGQRVEERWPETGPFVPIVATIIAATLFTPTRHGFARMIDRVFFQIRYNHSQALEALRADLRGVEDQQKIADILAVFIQNNLGPTTSSVFLQDQDQQYPAGSWKSEGSPQVLLPEGVRVMALPESTIRPSIETEGFPAAWRDEGLVLVQTIEAEGNRFGQMVLSEKITGRRYVAEDLDLLTAAARETAICVHRISLKQAFVDEVVARHRIEEMNQFRSQFFAQFAHDLRSPLTSINWAAHNLLDGVVGEVSPPQVTCLEGIENSARQLVRLVNNLLEATRLESGMPEIEFTEMDLAATVAESLSKIRMTAETKNIKLEVASAGESLVTGNEEKFLEVIDNLIENAIRYAPPETQIDISITSTEESVQLVVQDRGPGLKPADLEAIFEPYRQGVPSPHSTQQGFGLGLFVVKSWVERMGGQVTAGNRQGGGAIFTITLPAHISGEAQEIS